MSSCAIDAKEGRYVVVTDISGAFLHSYMTEDIHMLLEATIVELIMKLEKSYTKSISGTTKMVRPYGTLQHD